MDEALERKRAQRREFYARHKVEILRKQKEKYRTVDGAAKRARVNRYRLENLEMVRAKKAVYRLANAEKIAAKKHRDYLANREAILASHRGNPVIAAYMKVYRVENKVKLEAQNRAWREQNVERHRAMSRVWREEHKAERVHQEGRRRIRKKGNGGSHTFAEWMAKCAAFEWRCAYCGAEGEMTRDHDIPVSRGGVDSIDNVVPACRSCNSSKHVKTGAEFRTLLQKAA